MLKPPFKVGTLGEVAIRCIDFDAMVNFYANVLGLSEVSGNTSPDIRFFNLGAGIAGHTTVLALFSHDALDQRAIHPDGAGAPQTGARSSLHHVALSLEFAEQEKAITWYEQLGQPYKIEHFEWVGWRGVFTEDPDGNTIELVAKVP